MSGEDSENTDGLEILTDEEDAAKDLELMKDIMQSIQASKRENDSSPESKVNHGVLPPAHSDVKISKTEIIAIDDMQLSSLNCLLEQLNQALECNQILQHALILKEVKLISLQRRLLSKKTRQTEYVDFQKDKEDELKGDIGKYIVRFKAPYFKDGRNFAGYSVVPRGSFPKTAQYFEERAIEWKKPDLKELEKGVRQFLIGRHFRSTMNDKDSTPESRAVSMSSFNFNRTASLSKLVPPDFDHVIDWCLIASKMGKLHTPYECQKAWDIFLKPTLNRKPWSKNEKRRLKEIALEHNYEDWDTIAEELGSARSGYQCFSEFQDLISKIAEGDWSKEENEYLIKLVKECSYGEKILWHKVAYYFGTRSLSQIYRKWNLSSVSKQFKSGPFSEYEDRVILTKMLNDDSTTNQNLVARQLNRMSCQIRYRFTQLMTSLTVKFGEWSMEEDKLLLECVEKYGTKNWAKVAEHIPQRDRIQARHRHRHIRQRMRKYPDMKLEDFHRERRTVYKSRKQATLKYVMNLAGIQESDGNNEVIKIRTAVGDLVINPGDLEEEETFPKKVKPKKDLPHVKIVETVEPSPETLPNPLPSTSRRRRHKAQVIRFGFDDEPAKPKSQKAKQPKKPENPLFNPSQNLVLVKLSGDPVVDFYRQFARFKGDPGLPKSCCDSRPDVRAISKVLDFKPYKHFDIKNSEWVYNMDKYDPYYRDVLETAENLNVDYGNSANKLVRGANVIPPSVTVFEGFCNLLKDIDFKESDLEYFDPNELTNLYDGCDAEMVDAMLKWKDRLKSLFLWPSALSQVDVVTGENQNAESKDAQDKLKDDQDEAILTDQKCSVQEEDTIIDMSQIPEDVRDAIVQSGSVKMSTDNKSTDKVSGLTLLELNDEISKDVPPDTRGVCEILENEDVKINDCLIDNCDETVSYEIEASIKTEKID